MKKKLLRGVSYLLMMMGSLALMAIVAISLGFPNPIASGDQVAAQTLTPMPSLEIVSNLPEAIVADAKLIPLHNADLSMDTNGIVVSVPVVEGERVEQGQVLLRFDPARSQVAVAQAEANLMQAQARLDELLAGSRQEDIAAAQATLDAASGRLAALQQSTDAGDYANAEAVLAAAQANLQKVLDGASSAQLIEARANIQNAEAELRRAQSAYDEVRWRNDIGALPQAAALETATNNYEAARARLNNLENGATSAEIAAANASVAQAVAALDALRAQRPEDIAVREADVRNAQAQLDRLLNGTRPEQIASAQAEVAGATAALQQQLVALSNMELRAPFAGTVAWLDIEVGEYLQASKSVLRLADVGAWQIETDDLTELQVVRIEDGQAAGVTFDALPDLTLNAVVQTIRPYGEDSFGDVVYQVILRPERVDPRFRWNMSAVVTFPDAGN